MKINGLSEREKRIADDLKSFADSLKESGNRREYVKRQSCRACGDTVEAAFLPTDHFQSVLRRCRCGELARITFLKGEERA